MNRSDDDQRTIEKVKQIVKDHFPGFASRYFNYNMYLKAPRSLYGYALDLKSFFENDKYTVLRHYRPLIDRYECTKGTEFSNNSV